ncbi:hypothetical protein CEE39_09960 [bacterium (candidate division B38) B3_B38]|nr:MAG: hypothetical protein CEE39_09960 [bacterium (candidate division B38) B3_B38]
MENKRKISTRMRITVMYLVAILLIILVPLIFISFGSGIVQKLGKKIPIKEGTFDPETGGLILDKSER